MSILFENTKGDKVEFGVMSIPNRKSKALFIARGANIDVLAYFTSDDNADRFQKALDYVIEICAPRRGK